MNQTISLLLEGIEEFRITSGTPEGKRIMIPSKVLATYIVHGTLRVKNPYEKNIPLVIKVRNRINKLLARSNAIRSTSCWVITKENISFLEKKQKIIQIL